MRIVSAVLLACAFTISGCGGKSPTSATPAPLSLNGTWSGTWTFVTAGVTVSDAVTMTLAQAGTSASGQWSSASGAGGTVSFTVAADFAGTATISQTLISGVNCSTSTTVTGTASSSQIRFAFGVLTPANLCQWAANHQFTFMR